MKNRNLATHSKHAYQNTAFVPIADKNSLLKKTEYFKRIRDISLNKERTILLRIVTAKCLNPDCKRTSFALPNGLADKFSRSTRRRKDEAVSILVDDNAGCERAAKKLSSSFNAGCGKSTVDRWKHEMANRHSFAEIIPKLDFSGILGLDEVKPRRSKKYAYIASDVKHGKILYMQTVKRRDVRNTKKFLLTLKGFGPDPDVAVIDMWKGFPEALSAVFPNAIIQYDFFHVMKEVHRPLYAALTKYRRQIKKSRNKKHLHAFLWKNRYKPFTGEGKLTRKDRKAVRRLLREHKGTILEEIFQFRKDVRKIFDSKTYSMAVKRRDALRKKYRRACFRKVIKFLSSKKFEFMTSFLRHKEVPRAGNSETMIRTFRQMEKARYGFKTESGLQDHLKLFQLRKYLGLQNS